MPTIKKSFRSISQFSCHNNSNWNNVIAYKILSFKIRSAPATSNVLTPSHWPDVAANTWPSFNNYNHCQNLRKEQLLLRLTHIVFTPITRSSGMIDKSNTNIEPEINECQTNRWIVWLFHNNNDQRHYDYAESEHKHKMLAQPRHLHDLQVVYQHPAWLRILITSIQLFITA